MSDNEPQQQYPGQYIRRPGAKTWREAVDSGDAPETMKVRRLEKHVRLGEVIDVPRLEEKDCGYCVWEWNNGSWDLISIHCNLDCTPDSPAVTNEEMDNGTQITKDCIKDSSR